MPRKTYRVAFGTLGVCALAVGDFGSTPLSLLSPLGSGPIGRKSREGLR